MHRSNKGRTKDGYNDRYSCDQEQDIFGDPARVYRCRRNSGRTALRYRKLLSALPRAEDVFPTLAICSCRT